MTVEGDRPPNVNVSVTRFGVTGPVCAFWAKALVEAHTSANADAATTLFIDILCPPMSIFC